MTIFNAAICVQASTHAIATACLSILNISGGAVLNNSTTKNVSLFVLQTTILQGNATTTGNLNVAGVLCTSFIFATNVYHP